MGESCHAAVFVCPKKYIVGEARRHNAPSILVFPILFSHLSDCCVFQSSSTFLLLFFQDDCAICSTRFLFANKVFVMSAVQTKWLISKSACKNCNITICSTQREQKEFLSYIVNLPRKAVVQNKISRSNVLTSKALQHFLHFFPAKTEKKEQWRAKRSISKFEMYVFHQKISKSPNSFASSVGCSCYHIHKKVGCTDLDLEFRSISPHRNDSLFSKLFFAAFFRKVFNDTEQGNKSRSTCRNS